MLPAAAAFWLKMPCRPSSVKQHAPSSSHSNWARDIIAEKLTWLLTRPAGSPRSMSGEMLMLRALSSAHTHQVCNVSPWSDEPKHELPFAVVVVWQPRPSRRQQYLWDWKQKWMLISCAQDECVLCAFSNVPLAGSIRPFCPTRFFLCMLRQAVIWRSRVLAICWQTLLDSSKL